ncbi:MAG: sigma-70 family RNA polymerase sigma factor [Nitrospirota bacterium]
MREWDIFEEIIDRGKRRDLSTYGEMKNTFSTDIFLNDQVGDLVDYPEDIDDIEDNVVDDQKMSGDNDITSEDLLEEHEKSEDLVQAYFHSMGDIPILTRDEEIELAKKIETGKKLLSEILNSIPLYKKMKSTAFGEEDEEIEKERVLNLTVESLRNLMSKVTSVKRKMMSHKFVRKRNARTDFRSINEFPDTGEQKELKSIEAEVGLKIADFKEKWEKIDHAMKFITEARNELIIRNLRLVISIAKRYIGRGLPLLDLIQEGNIGLMRAAEKFKYRKGFKFSTYASWWIKQAISRALMDQAKTIRIPVHMMDFYNKIVRSSRELTQQLGREPSNEEIAKKLRVSVGKVEQILKSIQDPITLQACVGEDEDTKLEDFISDKNTPSPYKNTEKSKMTDQILKILHTLTAKEERVIRMRFGIGEDRDHTLEEIGRRLAITRERVRQIEAKALNKLKHPSRLRALRS